MGLSRLDNFLKNTRGNILYVSPNDVDATDSVENQGNSLARPFVTIQRALVEAARFSYQRGLDNDRFGKTTILVYPGEHYIDNRPGWIPDGSNSYRLRNGTVSNDFPPFDSTSNFDLTNPNNQLYKFNSVYGGVIVPRGTSLVGYDLRKTKIRPLYVPNPENSQIERSAIFRVTGACYFWQFTLFDSDPNGRAYTDYTNNTFVPNFSHHKLSAFEYADGVNGVTIDDDFQVYKTDRTDLDMYYEKIGLAYGQASGRDISPDYPSGAIDIQTNVNEYRIVGSTGAEVGISSIKAGDGVLTTPIITVTTDTVLPGLDVDTAIRISGVGAAGYDGQYVVSEVVSPLEIKYQVQNAPVDPLPTITDATLNIQTDTVTSASPYIFNCSLRSVYGLNGIRANGDNADGFKSMMVAQFTGISLQKDNNAFVKYNKSSGTYEDTNASGNESLATDPLARYKPNYEHYHIYTTNDAYIQVVSCFAIGYASHFTTENGGDMSITNSNSNFGAKALSAIGFKRNAFPQDDRGYISHIVPPKQIETDSITFEYNAIDVEKTVGVGSTSSLYLYNQTNQSNLPDYLVQGYRIGSKNNETLHVLLSSAGVTTEYSARVVMPPTQNTSSEISSKKKYTVQRSAVGINSINNNVVTLTSSHQLINGESIRMLSDTGEIPDGLVNDFIYYAITSGTGISSDNQLKIAQTLNDAVSDTPITINSSGGVLTIESRVADKRSGDIGHPIQFDSAQNNWYVQVSGASTENSIYPNVVGLGTSALGEATPRTFLSRIPDNRNLLDTIYRLRYVIPKESGGSARPPVDGSILQESGTTIGESDEEVAKYFSPTTATLSNATELRNFRIISNASWTGGISVIETEVPHNLIPGANVEILNIKSSNNVSGAGNTGFNGFFTVVGISSTKQFSVGLGTDPGVFTSDINTRDVNLPHFKRKTFNGTYSIYQSRTLQEYEQNESDGIYQLLIVNNSYSPSVTPFTGERFAQPIQNLYPRIDRDNPVSDIKQSRTFALSDEVGETAVNDPENSISKESLGLGLIDFNVGIALTDFTAAVPVLTGTAVTFFTSLDHGLNRATKVSIVDAGSGYGSGSAGTLYDAKLVGAAGSVTGKHTTALVTVDASGSLTDVRIIDGGSAHGIGHTLVVTGTATTTGFADAVVQVDEIYNNVGDSFGMDNLPVPYHGFNNFYEITNVGIGEDKKVTLRSTLPILPAGTTTSTLTGVGVTIATQASVILTGKVIDVSGFSYDNVSGIATITTIGAHGYLSGNKFFMAGSTSPLYTGFFIVDEVPSLTTLTTKIGIGTVSPALIGSLKLYFPSFGTNGGNITATNDKTSGRNVPQYLGITTTLSSSVGTLTIDEINITNVDRNDILIGDYLQIGNEIVRVKQTVNGNPVKVFRGSLGSIRQTHLAGTVVKRIKPRPLEFRRNSIIRASGHTFEYVGFGPGNYSTSLPQRQTIELTDNQRLTAQSFRENGGVVNFTGMDDAGNFYIGNKRTSSSTGQEESYDIPIPTNTGDPLRQFGSEEGGFDIIDPLQVTIRRSLSVEGGSDSDAFSNFEGPVIFNNKVTSTSQKGLEVDNLLIQGNSRISRRFTVGIATPSLAGNPGDVVFYASPIEGGFVGWVYTVNNNWKRFGQVTSIDSDEFQLNQVGVATANDVIGISTTLKFVGTGITITNTFDAASGISTINFVADNPETPDQLYVTGLSTFIGLTTASGGSFFSGISTYSAQIDANAGAAITGGLRTNELIVSGIATFGTIGTTGFEGNVSIGSSESVVDRTLTVLAGDAVSAGIEAMGKNSGTGYLYLGRNSSRGGGVVYPGDLSPSPGTGAADDSINFYRKNAGANEIVFYYPYNSNEVTFRGTVNLNSNLNASTAGIVTAGIVTARSLFSASIEGGNSGVVTTGIVTAVSVFGTNLYSSNNISIGNSIIDSSGQTGISSSILTSTPTGVKWSTIGDIFGANVTTNDVSASRATSTTYTNNTSGILWVSCTVLADSYSHYAVAFVDGTEVSLFRDNGSARANNVWLNNQFWVPRGSTYVVRVYDQNNVEDTTTTVRSWVEQTFG